MGERLTAGLQQGSSAPIKNRGEDKSTTKTVLFAGAYGIENAGDDLPLIVMCEHLRDMHPDVSFDFRALSRHPSSWEEQAYGVSFIKNLEYESREQAAGKWFSGMNPGDDSEALCRVRNEIKNADLLVLGAGNWLIDITIDVLRGPIPLLALYVFMAKMYHTPVMLYSLSAGPLNTEYGRDLTCWIMENADVVTVRDMGSKQLLEKLQVPGFLRSIHQLPDCTVGACVREPDIAGADQALEGKAGSGEKKLVAVGLRDLQGLMGKSEGLAMEQALAECMNAHKADTHYIFVPQSTYAGDDDRRTAERFAGLLDPDTDHTILTRRLDPRELIALYSRCAFTLAIRLHAAVFSAIAGRPVLAINYLPKVRGFMEKIHMQDFCLDMDKLNTDGLNELFINITDNRLSLSQRIEQDMDLLREQVTAYARLASDCLFPVAMDDDTGRLDHGGTAK